jgi:hypothetical protein
MSDTPRTDHEEIDMRKLEGELNEVSAAFSGLTAACSQCNERATKRCDWKQDSDGDWSTSCQRCMCFEYAPPNEQGYRFCHHCGHSINFIEYEDKEP